MNYEFRNAKLGPLKVVPFEKKTNFSANRSLAFTRSTEFIPPKTLKHINAWDAKAPDFSPKLYRTLSLPRERSERRQPPVPSNDTLHRMTSLTAQILPEIRPREVSPPFILRYRPPDALECNVMFVKCGKYPQPAYKNPKPHDFRQYTDEMPDIVTTIEKDPNNLKIKSQNLAIIGCSRAMEDIQQRETLPPFHTFKPAEPRWDARLILPKHSWPAKSASFTRHRRRRGVYSAFMDRVEEKLTSSWRNC